MKLHPFKAEIDDLRTHIDDYVDVVFASLESDFLIMPKGQGFVEYQTFEDGYEVLKQATNGFAQFDPDAVLFAMQQKPMVFIVLRSILGFTPPEWAYMATNHSGTLVSQGHARTLDRNIRLAPETPMKLQGDVLKRVKAMVQIACTLIQQCIPKVEAGRLHRLDKADTAYGPTGLQNFAKLGVPYAMLLYERFLGRPFAGHRDSVSELVGDSLESSIEEVLTKAKITFRKTKRAERIPGFDQSPDFIIPSEFNPQVVIEAKITEDDGTARDKVTRIQHLAELSERRERQEGKSFVVIACIGGRGFGVRREDMRKLLLATKGKVFTPKTIKFMTDVLGRDPI